MASSFDSTLDALGIPRTNSGTPVQPASSANTTLGQADFLKLMTAQMQNQDPFDPVDNTQMVAQMAQFSSLAGITEMSTTLKSIADKLNATSASDAMAYVGKTVLTEGSVAYPRTAGGFAGQVELDGDASGVILTIADKDGKVLKSVDLGAQKKGTVDFDWDGSTDTGSEAGDGPFTITATARNGTTQVASRTLVWAPVASVSIPSTGEPVLSLPGVGQVPVSAVRQVG
ncbi:flagellar hook assembly protein FlgD [Sphingomonas sp. DT-204]|uniref:flagellar hook assembly protein FlgD n=1 Tax=Sphingomonas sp. DT-204 TaxID=3396166 RepID=UPI003F1A3DAA